MLYDGYRPQLYAWELVEALRKLLLTGVLSLLFPGTTAQLIVGVVLALAALILAWVGQAEVAQRIQTRLGYDKPWAVGWLNHGAMALLLPLVWLHDRRAFRKLGASARAVALRCAFLALVYTLADYCWYLGLARTAVSEATALFNAQSVFTYALSVCVLGEKVRASPRYQQ